MTKIIPEPYQDKRRIILIWVLIGFFIRLILMPLTLHPDLLEPYWAADKIVNRHILNLGQYVKEEFGVYGGNYLAPLAYIHAIFLWLLKPFMSPHQMTALGDSRLIGIFTEPLSSREAIFSFVSSPHIFRSLFLLKLPYLFFDFASSFLILKIIKDVRKGLLAFKFWMVNFVGLFVTYIWGKYEIIPVFLILLSIFFARKNKIYLSMLAIGLSAILKYYTLLFLLPFAFVLGKTSRQRIKLTAWGMFPLLLLIILVETTNSSGFGNSLRSFLQMGMQGPLSFLLNKITLTSSLRVYLFPLFYGIILLHSYFSKDHPIYDLEKYSLSLLLFFYAVSNFFPQYLMWMMPFFVLQLREHKGWLSLHHAQILSLLIFALDGGLAIAKFFLPLNPSLMKASLHPPSGIRQLIHPLKGIMVSLSRATFSVVSLWMIYQIFKNKRETINVKP